MAFAEIMLFIGSVMSGIFYMLDNTYIDTNLSVLDVFLSVLFLDLAVWFGLSLMNRNNSKGSG